MFQTLTKIVHLNNFARNERIFEINMYLCHQIGEKTNERKPEQCREDEYPGPAEEYPALRTALQVAGGHYIDTDSPTVLSMQSMHSYRYQTSRGPAQLRS